ncbi:MAG: DUF1572 domain-containing protein [Chitinophagaceae bacterium]|nr:DUF1572 domain-containing protein [Chitinophagaceae bacterium]
MIDENTLIQDVNEILVRDLKALYHEMEEIPEAHLWRVLPGVINPIGSLSHHICGNLRHFIGNKLGHDAYVRNREDEFLNHRLSKAFLLQEIEETSKVVAMALGKLNAADLNLAMPDPPVQHEGKSIGFFLIQLCCHLSRHRGQMNYIRRILLTELT